MADITLSYKGSTIATLSASGSKTIQTQGKYCEADIVLSYIKPPSAVAYHVRTISATSEYTAIGVTKGTYNFDNVGAVPFLATAQEQTINFSNGTADVDLDGNIRVQSTSTGWMWIVTAEADILSETLNNLVRSNYQAKTWRYDSTVDFYVVVLN